MSKAVKVKVEIHLMAFQDKLQPLEIQGKLQAPIFPPLTKVTYHSHI